MLDDAKRPPEWRLGVLRYVTLKPPKTPRGSRDDADGLGNYGLMVAVFGGARTRAAHAAARSESG